jgi:cytoskeletal protein RodZ
MAVEAGGIGARLRASREKLGLTVLQVAERIHTDPKIVDAIEAENYEALGAPVYARGHIRHYAELVGESQSDLIALYSDSSKVAQPDLTRIVKVPAGTDSSKLVAPALLVIAVFAVAGAVWWVSSLSKKKPQLSETHVVGEEAPAAAPESAPDANAMQAQPAPSDATAPNPTQGRSGTAVPRGTPPAQGRSAAAANSSGRGQVPGGATQGAATTATTQARGGGAAGTPGPTAANPEGRGSGGGGAPASTPTQARAGGAAGTSTPAQAARAGGAAGTSTPAQAARAGGAAGTSTPGQTARAGGATGTSTPGQAARAGGAIGTAVPTPTQARAGGAAGTAAPTPTQARAGGSAVAPNTDVAQGRTGATAGTPAPPRSKNQAQVTLHYSADSWTEVYDASGARLFYDVGAANSVQTVVGKPPLRVVLGNASGVAVQFNGRNTPVAKLALPDGSVQFSINRSGRVVRAKPVADGG